MNTNKKVLFISYFFEPHNGVGAQRISYWAKNIAEYSNNIISCDVITNTFQETENHAGICNVFFVAHNNKSFWSYVIKDQGLYWKKSVKDFLYKNMDVLHYDAIIMSGGPFMQFSLTPFLKDLFGCKVILDFRDPFANNPRFNNSYLKTVIKKYIEQGFIKNADHVITVNEYCLKLLTSYNMFKDKFSIIENGFNEKEMEHVGKRELHDNAKIKFLYAGTLYQDRNPVNFLKTISNKQYAETLSFHHVGNESCFLDDFRNINNIYEYGQKPYRETMDIINAADVGLIFTKGFNFESTVKIFDYIGLNKSILVVTDGEVKTGSLHKITKDYPSIFWAKNEKVEIERVLEKILNSDLKVVFDCRYKYSKKKGLKKLINIINKL